MPRGARRTGRDRSVQMIGFICCFTIDQGIAAAIIIPTTCRAKEI
jgi:hypothetical protein